MSGEAALNKLIDDYSPIGKTEDMIAEATGVESVEDVYFSQTKTSIKIVFGLIDFEFDKALIISKSMIERLEKLNITIKVVDVDTARLRLFYKGEPIREVRG